MSNLLKNIKSNYISKIIIDYIPYIKFLKIIRHSKIILNKFGITSDSFQKVAEVKRVLDPSYEIQNYYTHFEIKRKKEEINEKMYFNELILYKCLNSSDFSIKLRLSNENFETIINNVVKLNLIIEYDTIFYLEKIKQEEREKIFSLLNINNIHITELTIRDIYLNEENVDLILYILDRIFQRNNPNKYHRIKKLNLFDNYAHYNINTFLEK